MLKFNHTFERLKSGELSLSDDATETAMEDWLVITFTHRDDGLFYQTNVEALTDEINRVRGSGTMQLMRGFFGEKIALMGPTAPDAAFALATAYVAEMDAGQHLDLALYHRAL